MLYIMIFLVLFLAGLIPSLYFFRMALDRFTDKGAALRTLVPDETANVIAHTKPSFFETVQASSVFIRSYDGLKLHALCIENGHNWIIMQHGYTGKAQDMGNIAESFYTRGYSILAPDARAHGKSEGRYIGMGYQDRRDLLGWVDYILQKDAEAKIVFYGISMGGATVMLLAGESLPENVKGIIEDCGYSSTWEEFCYQLTRSFKLPKFYALYILFFADILVRLFAHYSLHDADAKKALKKASVPMLFLHGERDSFVPFFMLDKVYEAAATKDKQMLSFPGAEHGLSMSTDAQRYWQVVFDFTERMFN